MYFISSGKSVILIAVIIPKRIYRQIFVEYFTENILVGEFFGKIQSG